MEFSKLILEKIHSLFDENNFKLVLESKNQVRYKSDDLYVAMNHNPRENSNILWIGRNNFQEVEIDNQVMKEFFNSDLKLSSLPKEKFAKNVFLFFLGVGEDLLKGNSFNVVDLEIFNEKRSLNYTESLIKQQSIQAAGKAWREGNYSDVIKHLGKINKDSLPASLKKKYEIAQQQVNN